MKQRILIGLVAWLGLVGSASANLLDRGPDMVYDDVLNITWTRNANLLGSSGLNWAAANSWAAGLVFGGFSDWRLPTMSSTSPATSIFDCSTGTAAACAASRNELGYMFYHNLGGTFGTDKTGTQTSLLGGQTLTGIQPLYWSGTGFNSSRAWGFNFVGGHQFVDVMGLPLSAWAVRAGDVALIPEPETYAMMLAGLGLMGFVARRRKRKAAAGA